MHIIQPSTCVMYHDSLPFLWICFPWGGRKGRWGVRVRKRRVKVRGGRELGRAGTITLHLLRAHTLVYTASTIFMYAGRSHLPDKRSTTRG